MRKAAGEMLSGINNFISIDGSAENTTLENACADFITCAQAFHWFDIEKSLIEFRRILKDNGLMVLIWNNRLNNTEFLNKYDQALIEFGTDYEKVNHQNLTDEILKKIFKAGYRKSVFKNSQTFDLNGLLGRLFSSSYTPTKEHPNYYKLIEEMKNLFDRYNKNGSVKFYYNTEVFSGSI